MKSRALILGLLLPAAIVLNSCAKREDATLAQFKDRKITVGEFEDAYAKVSPEFLPAAKGVDGLKEFLTTMLNKEVMAYKADELGYDKDPTVVQGMDAFKKMGLQAGYLKRKVADKITVTDDDIQKAYNNTGVTLSIKQILVDTPEEADHVYDLLQGGADFETVCKEYSKGPDASQGGRIVTVAYGAYAPTLQRPIFALDVGQFSKPILSPYGYFIIKVLKRSEPVKRDPLKSLRARIERKVRAEKEMMATNALSDQIREKYHVQWYWDNLRICFDALPPDRPLDQAPRRSDETYPLLYFDQQDLTKPLVTYAGKTVTVSDFSDYYDRASFFTRPRREYRLGGIRSFLTERIMSDLVVREMKKSDIENDPEVKKVLDAKREELMVNRLWDDLVNSQTVVTEKAIRDYYDNNIDSFKNPERRRFGVILTSDYDTAKKAYDEIKKGGVFRTVAMAYSIDEKTKKSLAQTDLLKNGEQPEIDKVGFALPDIGSVSEPFQTSRGWMILKVTEIEPASTYTLQQARSSIRSTLKQKLNDDRLNELLDKWKKELGVVINEGNLAKIHVKERSKEEEAQPSSNKTKRT